MTLEEYRAQVIEGLKVRPDIASVRDLLEQTHWVLTNTGVSARTQQAFWAALDDDLEILALEGAILKDAAAPRLAAAIAVAQSVAAQYLKQLADDPASSPQ